MRIVVVGTMAANPFAGMAWMHMQIAAGFRALGHDVYYFEFTSDWPYDPVRRSKLAKSDYAVPYLRRVAELFGLSGRWAYRQSYADNAWFGLEASEAERMLATADLVFNVSGATKLAKERLDVRRWVYLGTDPVLHEVRYAARDPYTMALIDEHHDVITYGENIGTSACAIPPLPRMRGHMRQPLLLDKWNGNTMPGPAFTTVTNWLQVGLDVEFNGELYRWSKHHEFINVIDLPKRTSQVLELALNMSKRKPIRSHDNEAVPAIGPDECAKELLEKNGWRVIDGPAITMDPSRYRRYILESRGEFTVARDLNVRLHSGWFSERSACYLAAGRPVVTQDTGFARSLPTGCGLFAFRTVEGAVDALEAISAEYEKHSRAAREIAREYFAADRVLPRLLSSLSQ